MSKRAWLFIVICSLFLCGCRGLSNKDNQNMNNPKVIMEHLEDDTKILNSHIDTNKETSIDEIDTSVLTDNTESKSETDKKSINDEENTVLTGKEENTDTNTEEVIDENKPIEEVVLTSSVSHTAIDLINQKRSEAGLSQLSYSSYLGNIAMERAKQIVDDFSHNKFYSDYQSKDYKLGECLAFGYGSALNAVNGWMASSSHKSILMDTENVSIGVAYCDEYWVAIVSY